MNEKDRNEDLSRTTPLSTKELSGLQRLRSKGVDALQVSLLFHHRSGVKTVTLNEGQSLIVGRAHPADLEIPDNSLSRQHASLELIDGHVWVEDLDSTNGTRVDGKLIERSTVKPGSELMLGAVSAVVHTLVSGESPLLGLESHDRFLRALNAEVTRAKTFSRAVALVLVRGRRDRAGHIGRWLSKIQGRLRSFDVAALYCDDTVEVLLPETDLEGARALVEALVGSGGKVPLECGVAVIPIHAATSDEVLGQAREALQRATDENSVQIAASQAGEVFAGPGESDSRPVARSRVMERVFETARRFADATMPVLIRGETGTGKEVVARAIHDASERRDEPMISVNCGAIPEALVESSLFGHERGAFTGADRQSKGVFESANGGTVFLDEIGEMPLQAQAALLRVLETKRFCRVGSTKEIEVDVRVIAATHRDLEKMGESNSFRRDLFFRLDAMAINIPPLRKREEDVEPLISRFIQGANVANGRDVKGVDDEALELIRQYEWPGNVRELRNAIERAVVIARDVHIQAEDLPERIRQLARGGRARARLGELDTGESLDAKVDLRGEVARFEAGLIVRALQSTNWDRNEAAKTLGLPVRTLSHKIKNHGITKPD